MKKKFFRAVLCLILAFTLILSVSAESVSDLLNGGDSGTEAEVIIGDDTENTVEFEEETDAVEPADTGDNEIIALRSADTDVNYGLYGGYDGQDSMDDMDFAGACVGWDPVTLSVTADSGSWWIDDYYVGSNGLYYVEETDDFSLKYQIEFHAAEDIAAGDVQIVMDASLGNYRNGNNIIPTDIGIPYGTPDNYTETSSSPFNYYYIDADGNILTEEQAKTAEGVQIVMWNYRDIEAGSNAMVQVLYGSMDAMQIPDMTEWAIGVTATVDSETVVGNTLTGCLDTYAEITSVTKSAYSAADKSYTPGLYTESQVKSYISNSLGEPYASSFDDYIYVVWTVSLRGDANQAYEITIDESTMTEIGINGAVVGYMVYNTSTSTPSYRVTGSTTDGDLALTFSSSTIRDFRASFYVVTAYPASSYEQDVQIYNDVTVTVQGADGYDAATSMSADANTTWGDYSWTYAGDGVVVQKEVGTTWSSSVSSHKTETYYANLTLYEQNSVIGKDTGGFPFVSRSTNRSYSLTHYTSGTHMGEYRPGSYYTTTTVDDALYLYPNGQTEPSIMLGKDDYYFSSVRITNTSYGYDVYEDKTAEPETHDGVDQDLYVYAMYYEAGADADKDGWEYVGKAAWSDDGIIRYTFSSDDLARQPYRVKVVHTDTNYETDCDIAVEVTLRYDSPAVALFMEEYGDGLERISIENVSGVAAQDQDGAYYQSTSTSGGNYSEKDTYSGETLVQFTEGLYGTILMRGNAYVILTSLEETSDASKSVVTQNDTANSRVLADYYVTAYEAYYVTGEDTVEGLQDQGISMPSRNEVSFYDLLPYGMKYNGSVQPVAGRITAMNSTGSWRTNTNAWSKTGVSVTVTDDDIIDNWNGTGRTLVIFHLTYDGDDASEFYDRIGSTMDLWYEGYGIYFQGYYDWTDLNSVNAEYNIAAYIAEGVETSDQQLLGEKDMDVWKDDGSGCTGMGKESYLPFDVEDLNGDEITDLYTNMYARAMTNTNVATSSTDAVKKTVRADDDVMAEYGSTAVVGAGGSYTYEIMLTNLTGATMSDIVLFDRLENAVEDGRAGVETGSTSVYNGLTGDEIDNHWAGTFTGVTVAALENLGIAPVVYYNTDRDATITSEDGTSLTPDELFSGNYGWVMAEDYTGDLSEVKAVAIDASTMTNDEPYGLQPGDSLSFRIQMTAPDSTDFKYAFNNPAYYSVSTYSDDSFTSATVSGNSARVEIGGWGTVEVVKELDTGDAYVPGSMVNTSFTFKITRNGTPLANQEYTVWEWNEASGNWVSTNVVRATDINGQFTLKADQKAVFNKVVDAEDVEVTEVESPYWEQSDAAYDNDDVYTFTYTNRYRSPAYFYKTALTTDLASDEELAEAKFTFRIEVDTGGDGSYEPYSNGTVLYVDAAATDGSSPTVIGETTTDADGYITLGIGDVIAFFPGYSEDDNHVGVSYRITETDSGNEWICENDTLTGTTADYGTIGTIENYYKYRALILTKDLADYDHDIDSCEAEWTFRITDADGYAVTGLNWYEIDADGEYTGTSGTVDDNGEFTVSGAGSGHRFVVTGLVEGKEYTITETNYEETLFEPVNDGTVTVTMPTYSITRNATITNQYLLRDLTVEKIALTKSGSSGVTQVDFEFTLKDGDGYPIANMEYTIEDGDGTVYTTDESGRFTLRSGETAYFDDIGYVGDVYVVSETENDSYPQIYPAERADGSATLTNSGGSMLFVNGDFEDVVSVQKSIVGMDDVGEAYVKAAHENNYSRITLTDDKYDDRYAVDVTLGVYDSNGNPVTSSAGDIIAYTENNSSYPYVYIYIDAGGNVTVNSYNGGVMVQKLWLGDTIYIAEVDGNKVQFTETGGIIDGIFEVAADAQADVGSDYIYVGGNVTTGTAASGEHVTLVNEIWSAHQESAIYKLMTDDFDNVPNGSRIVFRVEVYDAATNSWSPASGIRYITMDGYEGGYDEAGTSSTSGVLETGTDGWITLTKTGNGYPWIRFIDDEVSANVYTNAADGQLRIVELLNESDDDWGRLVGYDSDDWSDGPALNITQADTFVNGNDDSYHFDVEKVSDTADVDDTFTFTLEQVISASVSPITSSADIVATTAGSNVYYIIYDSDTGAEVGSGYTDSNGRFTLQANQYAEFYVPAGTVWTVYEGVTPGYVLQDVSANDEPDSSVIDGTTGLIGGETYASARATIILTLTDEAGNPIQGGVFTLYTDGNAGDSYTTDSNGQISVKVENDHEYYFEQTETPDGYMIPDDPYTEKVKVPANLTSPTTYELTFKNSRGTAFAVYSEDDYSLTFYAGAVPDTGTNYNGKYVTNVYTEFEDKEYTTNSGVPWHSDCYDNVTSVTIDRSFSVIQPVAMAYWFSEFQSAEFSGLENIDTSKVTTLAYTFYQCAKLTDLDDLSGWDVSNVTTLAYTFASCNPTNVDGLSNWDVSGVGVMEKTFYWCQSLANVDGLSDWDVSNVTTLDSTFYMCSGLTNVNGLSAWNVSNVEDLTSTFDSCSNVAEMDLSGWDTSMVTKMYRTFNGCGALVTIYVSDGQFDTENVGEGDGSQMFRYCYAIKGGNGTTLSSDTSYKMAHIDTAGNPGYFTNIADKQP